MPELSSYETDSWVRYKWDTIQVCPLHHHHHQCIIAHIIAIIAGELSHHDIIFSASSLAAEVTATHKATQTGSIRAWEERGLIIINYNEESNNKI